jgi:hypothetical protein
MASIKGTQRKGQIIKMVQQAHLRTYMHNRRETETKDRNPECRQG